MDAAFVVGFEIVAVLLEAPSKPIRLHPSHPATTTTLSGGMGQSLPRLCRVCSSARCGWGYGLRITLQHVGGRLFVIYQTSRLRGSSSNCPRSR